MGTLLTVAILAQGTLSGWSVSLAFFHFTFFFLNFYALLRNVFYYRTRAISLSRRVIQRRGIVSRKQNEKAVAIASVFEILTLLIFSAIRN